MSGIGVLTLGPASAGHALRNTVAEIEGRLRMTRTGWIRSLAVGAFLALAATAARAEFATGASVSVVSGNFTSNVTDDGSKITAFDGVYVFDKTTNTGQTALVQVNASFNAGQTRTQLVIYTGTVANAYLSGVLFLDTNTGEFASWTASNAATQGPRLETAAEINRLERDGADVVGMTGMPEAALARELGLEYAAIAVSANFAAGRGESEHAVPMERIEEVLAEAMGRVRRIIEQLIGG